MKKCFNILIAASCLLPVVAFATTGGDDTFKDIYGEIEKYLTGSLGLTFVIMGFLMSFQCSVGFELSKLKALA